MRCHRQLSGVNFCVRLPRPREASQRGIRIRSHGARVPGSTTVYTAITATMATTFNERNATTATMEKRARLASNNNRQTNKQTKKTINESTNQTTTTNNKQQRTNNTQQCNKHQTTTATSFKGRPRLKVHGAGPGAQLGRTFGLSAAWATCD